MAEEQKQKRSVGLVIMTNIPDMGGAGRSPPAAWKIQP